jgi:hypothetical protein
MTLSNKEQEMSQARCFSQLRSRNVLGSQRNYFGQSRARNVLAVQEELLQSIKGKNEDSTTITLANQEQGMSKAEKAFI